MSNVDMSLLKPEFRQKVEAWLEDCKAQGVSVELVSGFRSWIEQAKLYRQGRATRMLRERMIELAAWGNLDRFKDLQALALFNAGAQDGDKIVTNSLPGESAHNVMISGKPASMAVDFVPRFPIYATNTIDDKPQYKYLWGYDIGKAVWDKAIELAEKHGLESGKEYHDYGHLQEPGFDWRDWVDNA